ncbi:hypothetical protein [Pantoea ananatis]|uniref:hypothetical protein n=1 Tax=Pantoea ananas TaxID=553 RepID=UPI0007DAE02E|nr:hypothetical protein [Pantoea ananatis]
MNELWAKSGRQNDSKKDFKFSKYHPGWEPAAACSFIGKKNRHSGGTKRNTVTLAFIAAAGAAGQY